MGAPPTIESKDSFDTIYIFSKTADLVYSWSTPNTALSCNFWTEFNRLMSGLTYNIDIGSFFIVSRILKEAQEIFPPPQTINKTSPSIPLKKVFNFGNRYCSYSSAFSNIGIL